jgi:hypothetical protein
MLIAGLCGALVGAFHAYELDDDFKKRANASWWATVVLGCLVLFLINTETIHWFFIGLVTLSFIFVGAYSLVTGFRLMAIPKEVPPVVPEFPKIEEPKIEPPPPFVIDTNTRTQHALILGGAGAGKTSLIKQLAYEDMQKLCSVVVFDSKGSLYEEMMRLNIARERVILIDPMDDFPIALGLFDFPTDGVTRREREENTNKVIELLTYTLSALEAESTSKQELPLKFLIRLCLTIPGATLLTLRDLLLPKGLEKHMEHVMKLPDTARMFFLTEYDAKDLTQTKQQIQRRIYTILEDPTLERVFSNAKTRFNMAQALDGGYVILVNTARGSLGAQRSAFFSRFIFVLIMQAVQRRDSSVDNLPAYVYIDEAAPIIDRSITDALETLREYKCGITLAFQSLSQVPAEYTQSIITNTRTKYVCRISAKDSRAIAEDMGRLPETLMATTSLTFAMHVKDKHDAPRTLTAVPGFLAKQPKRTDLKQLLEENRQKYCISEYPKAPNVVELKVAEDFSDLNKLDT